MNLTLTKRPTPIPPAIPRPVPKPAMTADQHAAFEIIYAEMMAKGAEGTREKFRDTYGRGGANMNPKKEGVVLDRFVSLCVLDALKKIGRPATVKEVSKECGRSKDQVNSRLRRLAEKGEVERFQAKVDHVHQRIWHYHLPEGE